VGGGGQSITPKKVDFIYMGNFFTTFFGRIGQSSSNTHTKIYYDRLLHYTLFEFTSVLTSLSKILFKGNLGV